MACLFLICFCELDYTLSKCVLALISKVVLLSEIFRNCYSVCLICQN